MDIETYAICKKKSQQYTDEKISAIGKGMEYKGSVSTTSDLPLTNNKKGYVYTVTTNGCEYVWSIDESSGTLDNWNLISGTTSKTLSLDAEETTKHIKDEEGNVLTFTDVYNLITDKTLHIVVVVSDSVACHPSTYDGTSIEFSNTYRRDNEVYVDRVIINSSNEVLYNEDVAVIKDNLKKVNGNDIYNVGGGNIVIKTYQSFPSTWTIQGTLETVVNSILSDSTYAKQGQAYLGSIKGEATPFGYGNVECIVTFMTDSIAVISVSSSNIIPYHWEYNTAQNDYKWRTFITIEQPATLDNSKTYTLQYTGGKVQWVESSWVENK